MSDKLGILSGSLSVYGDVQITGSLLGTASLAVSSSYSISASYINVTGSNIEVNWDGSLLQLTASAGSGGGGSQVYVSETAPSTSLTTGSLWWDSITGVLSVLYYDGSDTQWVEANYGGTLTTASSAISSVSSSYALTASYFFTESVTYSSTASYFLTSSVTSASFASTASYVSGSVVNIGDSYPSSPICNKIVTLSQAEYDAIGSKDPNTFYLITS